VGAKEPRPKMPYANVIEFEAAIEAAPKPARARRGRPVGAACRAVAPARARRETPACLAVAPALKPRRSWLKRTIRKAAWRAIRWSA
jgi:hypothetical protein